jgi:hypothetical protein
MSVGLIVLFLPTVWLATSLRSFGFRLAAIRARPLVEAVKRYEREIGTPPPTLETLVPKYLAAVPDGLPPLEIYAAQDAPARYDGNRWVLTALVPTGIINWDQFLYFPNQNYPAAGYGGWLERIEEWAYVHE